MPARLYFVETQVSSMIDGHIRTYQLSLEEQTQIHTSVKQAVIRQTQQFEPLIGIAFTSISFLYALLSWINTCPSMPGILWLKNRALFGSYICGLNNLIAIALYSEPAIQRLLRTSEKK